MNENPVSDSSLAYCLLRVVLGINIALHGISRLIAGPAKFTELLVSQFASTPLPAWSVHLFALTLPWAEALIGLTILCGVFTRWALLVGLLEIAALTLGTTLRQDWESAGLQLSYALVYALLLATRGYNTYSIDRLLRRSDTTLSQVSGEKNAPDPKNICRRGGSDGIARAD